MIEIEQTILTGARIVFNNPKLELKDIRYWSPGMPRALKEPPFQKGTTVVFLRDSGIWISIKKEHDKRDEGPHGVHH
jgi:hypothetical protein